MVQGVYKRYWNKNIKRQIKRVSRLMSEHGLIEKRDAKNLSVSGKQKRL